MEREDPTRPPKVAVYDRPAGADRPPRRWLALAVAVVAAIAWAAYVFLGR